ncbi:Hypothetical protein A7982_04822 [Minicystis rosea]|nr:Hypothetical protein A7982_04822 [Minicystis rosea]
MTLNERIIEATMEWGRDLPGFRPAHAAHAKMFAEAFAEGLSEIGRGGERALLLSCLDMACILWVDDWFDVRGPGINGDWEALAGGLGSALATTPEALGLSRLSARFRRAAAHLDEHRLWSETLADVLRASREDQRVSRGERTLSWAEYQENGEHNIAVHHTVFSLSLAYGLGLASIAGDLRFRRALRHLCLAMRLRNDLASAEKERKEGSLSNGLFVMERYLSPERAFAFVDGERRGYERMLERDLESFAPSHPFPRVARVLIGAAERFYQTPNSRYRDDE